MCCPAGVLFRRRRFRAVLFRSVFLLHCYSVLDAHVGAVASARAERLRLASKSVAAVTSETKVCVSEFGAQ